MISFTFGVSQRLDAAGAYNNRTECERLARSILGSAHLSIETLRIDERWTAGVTRPAGGSNAVTGRYGARNAIRGFCVNTWAVLGISAGILLPILLPLERVGQNTKIPGNQAKSYQALPSRTKLYQVVPSRTKSYQVVPSHTKSYQVIPSHTKSYQVIPSHTKSYQVVPSRTKSYQVVPSGANSYQVVLGNCFDWVDWPDWADWADWPDWADWVDWVDWPDWPDWVDWPDWPDWPEL